MDTKIVPAYLLRLYVWGLLQNNLGWTQVGGRIPVIPLGEEPQISDTGKNYVVYGWAEQSALPTLKQIKRGTFSLRIVANTISELSEIINTITLAFQDCDEAVENVNRWSSDFANDQFVGIRFTYLEASYVDGGNPEITEGGTVEGLVSIEYNYITQQKVKLYASNGTWA